MRNNASHRVFGITLIYLVFAASAAELGLLASGITSRAWWSRVSAGDGLAGVSFGRLKTPSLNPACIINVVEIEKTLLRKVGEAVHRFRMIRDGDRVAVALSGGKDSLTLLEALLLLSKRAPVEFSVCAFTVEQGKFLRPVEPLGDYLRGRGIAWTYFRDKPSLRLLEDQPDHGCDLCSRFRRRAV